MLKGDIPREAYIETIYMFEDPPYTRGYFIEYEE